MDPGIVGPLGDLIAGAGGAGGIKILERLFGVPRGDIPACTTRVIRGNRGMPWDKLIAVHPLPDGRIEIKALDPPKPDPPKSPD